MRLDRRWVVAERGEGEHLIPAPLRGEALGHLLHCAGQYTFCDRCGVFSSERGCKMVQVCGTASANTTAAYRLSLLRRSRHPFNVKVSLGGASRSLLQWECDAFWQRALD